MSKRSKSLQVTTFKVASPCSEAWDKMKGEGGVRHCGSCKQNVYDSSLMTLAEVEELMNRAGGACMRLYQRKDGTILTADCAVGAKRRRRKQNIAGLGLSALAALGYASSVETTTVMGEIEVTDDEPNTTMGYVAHDYVLDDETEVAQTIEDELDVIMGEAVAIEPELVIAEGEDVESK